MKSNSVKIFFLAVILVIAVGAGYFFANNKQTIPSEEARNYIPIVDDTNDQKFQELAVLTNSLYRDENDAGDEHQKAFIKNVYEKSGSIYIDADYYQWLGSGSGSDKDGCVNASDFSSGVILNTETRPKCGPNGFLITNNNSKIRTFKLSSGVKVRLFEDYGNIPDLHTLSPREFMNGHSKFGEKFYVYEKNRTEPDYITFDLVLKNGEIIFIHQVYVP